MALYSSESNRGWVSFKDKEWLECDVVDSNASHLTLKIKDTDGKEETKKVARKECQFAYRNPSAVEGSADFLTLPYLDEPNILHSLRVRYWQGHVYSYTGPILIAVNPWKRLDMYNAKILEMHKSGACKDPHIFAVASKALRELMNSRKNQCILISGESGSGKTESTKYVLQILTSSGPGEQKAGSSSIENQVMMTNPVLEAFGNAKTVRNDNSSRFGKWISVHFERKGVIGGAEIKTYLLEKARVVQQSENERNYHIFYQLCGAAASHKTLQDLKFGDASEYNYTKICLQARNMNDVEEFDETKKALHFIGFDADSQTSMFATLSAILHLGNMEISDDKDGNAALGNNKHFQAVCSLLHLDAEAMRKGLCSRLIVAGGEKMVKQETTAKAIQCRDALAKALYSRLFDNVVKCVNSALRVKSGGGGATMQASVLDIFGFEVFKVNRFEQFCINYANEKLQLHFNHYNFMLERQLYLREGIELVESDFVDNSASVELIENKAWGLQATLDDVCITPKGDDAMFLERLLQSKDLKTKKNFLAPKQRNGTFTVHHYADSVSYHVEEFCEKNKDLLVSDVVTMMQGSKLKFVAKLFDEAPAPSESSSTKPGRRPGGGGGASKSLSATFRADLTSLMEAINGADPHFVRAVNPNGQRKAELFEDFKAIEQLRCGGVIEAVRMCRESYPSRYPHDEFITTFSSICPEVSVKNANSEEAKKVCLAMVQSLKVEEKKYRLGSSLILLKREVVDDMEKKRGLLLVRHTLVIQNLIRRYMSRAVFEKKLSIRRNLQSILRLQTILRRSIAQHKYADMLGVVIEIKKRMSVQIGDSNKPPEVISEPTSSLADVSETKEDSISTTADEAKDKNNEPKPVRPKIRLEPVRKEPEPEEDFSIIIPETKIWQPLSHEQPESVPLCIRIQIHASGITEAVLFDVERLASEFRQKAEIKDHKDFFHVYPSTFTTETLLKWLSGHAAHALFGSEADVEKNQKLSRAVALNLGQKLLAVGVFRQVKGSTSKPFDDASTLFRFHEDEKDQSILNSRSIWFRAARDPLYVVSELLYKMLNLRLKFPNKDLRETEELKKFTSASAELQTVNINEMTRLELFAFFLNAYNLMVLHAHAALGSIDGTDFSSQKVCFKHNYQYMIAAYNYTLAEIEERLFSRMLRAKFAKNSDKSRAPESRVHFAVSLGCASSPRIRIYQPETLDEELKQATVEFLSEHAAMNRIPSQQRVPEVVLPRIFEWYKEDFGNTKQEILAYYATYLQPAELRKKIMEVARSNNFVLKYDKFDWSVLLSKVCSERYRQSTNQLVANTSSNSANMIGYSDEPAESVQATDPTSMEEDYCDYENIC